MLALAAFLFLLALLLLWLARRWRISAGMPSGRITYSDTDRRNALFFSSVRYGLMGKPDYVVYHNGDRIPIEVKNRPAPRTPFESHLLQLAAYCLLIEDATGSRPPFGRLKYRDKTIDVPFTDSLRQRLLDTMAAMQRDLATPDLDPLPQHHDPHRCAKCGYRDICGKKVQ